MPGDDAPADLLDLSLYDYQLPPELIAQVPAEPRHSARLLVAPRDGPLSDRTFADLPDLLGERDLLVVNDSRVLPARLLGERPTGGRAELLLIRRRSPGRWECLARPGRRLRAGAEIRFGDLQARIAERLPDGSVVAEFSAPAAFEEDLDQRVLSKGRMPLPPYIRHWRGDPERYQTVYARSEGSIAAPTAGLHFSAELLDRLQARGVRLARVTLHVGPGTFRPIAASDVQRHSIHAEWCELPAETVGQIEATKQLGGRVIAVGTTAVRTLEAAALAAGDALAPFSGGTDLFITPGFQFRVVDALVTNFHLPRTTLLLLVSAFLGPDRTRDVYRHAIEARYRFYSFGDAMFIP